jgi:gamma-glutamyltranspeptidase/glutathione hydrolase
MGHNPHEVPGLVDVNAIMRVRGGWQGVFEPRSGGGAIGY